jgi:hypothetical protein
MIKRNSFGFKYVSVPTNSISSWSISSGTIFTSRAHAEHGTFSDISNRNNNNNTRLLNIILCTVINKLYFLLAILSFLFTNPSHLEEKARENPTVSLLQPSMSPIPPSFSPVFLSVCLVNCCWPSPGQSFLVPSPAGLMTIFYCLTALGVVTHSLSRIQVKVKITLRPKVSQPVSLSWCRAPSGLMNRFYLQLGSYSSFTIPYIYSGCNSMYMSRSSDD